MKRSVIISITVVLLMLSASCNASAAGTATPTVIPPTATLVPTNWWMDWLAKSVCKPPCWENITPGVTTMDEATSIVEKMPGVTIEYKTPWDLTWDFPAKDEGGNIVGSEDRKVDCIWMGNSRDPALHLEQIIAIYDFPEYVKPYDCDPAHMCSVALLYPDWGLLVSTYTVNKGTNSHSLKLEVLPQDTIHRVYFFEAGIKPLDEFYVLDESELPMHWKGYGEYP